MAIIKGKRLRSEDLQEADYVASERDGCCQDGANSKPAAAGDVDAGISFRIVATQSFAGAYTLSGQA
jgi:hypothetical protein